MKKSKTRTVKYRRTRQGKTNYDKRLKLLLSGKPRIVLRRSNRFVLAQFIEYFPSGDKVNASVSSKELLKFGWKGSLNNRSSAYLTGLIFAKKIGGKECIFDIGLQTSLKGCVLYSFAKGCLDGGLKFNCSESMFPSDDVISGKNIADYAVVLKKDKAAFDSQFGKLAKNLDMEKIADHFKEVKQKILAK